MLIYVEISTFSSAFKSIDADAWNALREKVLSLPEKKPEWGLQEILVDDEGIDALIQAGLEVQVSKTKTATALRSMLVKLQDDISDHNLTKRSPSGHLAIGGERLIQIAVPDLPLMYIDEVMVLTDCCTDELQSMLNDGWRILAVCPPNSARRPDYVVGRRKTKEVS